MSDKLQELLNDAVRAAWRAAETSDAYWCRYYGSIATKLEDIAPELVAAMEKKK